MVSLDTLIEALLKLPFRRYFLFIFLFIFFVAQAQQDKILTFRKSTQWCPYECDEAKNNQQSGFIADIVRIVFTARGYQVKFDTSPIKRGYLLVRNGSLTGILGLYKSDAPDFIYNTLPIGRSVNEFIVRANDTWRYENIDSLLLLENKGLTIAKGVSYPQFDTFILENPHKVTKITGYTTLERTIKMITLGYTQTLYEDKLVLQYLAHQTNWTKALKYAGSDHVFTDVFVGFSPVYPAKSQELAKMLDLGIAELRNSGQLDEILKRYNIEDWQQD